MGGAGTQDGGDDLSCLAVADAQRVVHVLAGGAVIPTPLLRAVRGVVGAVQVEHDARRHAVPLALAQIDLAQRLGQPVAVPRRERALQAREGRLAGQVGVRVGQPAAAGDGQHPYRYQIGAPLSLMNNPG